MMSFRMISKAAGFKTTVLVTGESGVGKELVARALHRFGANPDGPFVAINCGAIPESLLESELFGHRRGSFTGAERDHTGAIEAARNGTVFLDEVGELPSPLQVKLLRFLQEGEIRPIGSNSTQKVAARVVAATHRDLRAEAEAGTFREDFYYRLSAYDIHLPPLRDRASDIPLLVEHFLKKYSMMLGKEISEISSYALEVLMGYDFPGNVRELQHSIERAVIMCDGSSLGPDDFILSSGVKSSGGLELESYNLEDIEKTIIEKVLKTNQGNVTQAATQLGLTRTSLYRRMEKHGL